ncbi:hypothetical protein COCVIDRAFT_102354 [Bipolaris victoriae FI3]|uniref:Uncharacterized protein n=2 Tax=Bipolaris TaxID=33194 RepID=W6XRJ9_COCC2|nr:uncharacterized protein COCCADRAFT_104839 [Bipolaris zeicola 26-R-13]XP_014555459.1 hypothetical protein COCVIDRAFT_102354 [Bipolaris victoriae FI3]EUC30077.1 hypothetical protein COCCADRAFT_104839 [Bipolaris zeicola 26-R-13]
MVSPYLRVFGDTSRPKLSAATEQRKVCRYVVKANDMCACVYLCVCAQVSPGATASM